MAAGPRSQPRARAFWITLAASAVVVITSCVSSSFPDGYFSCDRTSSPDCPPGLSCASDGRCRSPGSASADGGQIADAEPHDADAEPQDADAGVSRFCANQRHDLCLDFDDGGYLGWLASGEAISIDGSTHTSPPSSLVVSLPGSDRPHATLEAALPRRAAHVTCRMALRLEAIVVNGADTIVLSLHTTADYSLWLAIDGQQKRSILAEARTGGTSVPGYDLPIPSSNEWTVIVVDAALSPGGGTATVTIGGIVRADIALSPLSAEFTGVEIGAATSNAVNGATRVRIDDVACDIGG